MEVLFPTLVIFAIALIIMSVGVLMKRKPIQGSCGGIANMMGDCDFCEMQSECVEKTHTHDEEECDLLKKCTPIS